MDHLIFILSIMPPYFFSTQIDSREFVTSPIHKSMQLSLVVKPGIIYFMTGVLTRKRVFY